MDSGQNFDPAGRTRVKIMMDKIQELPTLPTVAVKALEAAMQEDVSISGLAEIIESDPAISLKLLKLVNSPKHGLAQKISTVHQAASYLGLTSIRCCLLGVITQDYLTRPSPQLIEQQQKIWSHSLACAVAGQLIAQKTYPELQQEAFTAGILHDIGKVVILLALPEEYLQLSKNAAHLTQEELKGLGCTHTQVGKWLASKWSLPESLTQSIHYHHHDPTGLQQIELHQKLIWIVSLADQLAHEFFMDQSPTSWDRERLQQLVQLLGLQDRDLDQLMYRISAHYSNRAHIFQLEGDPEQILIPVIQRSKQKLSSISLELEEQRQRLSYSNRLLTLSCDLAFDLGRSKEIQEILAGVAKCFWGWGKFYAGMIYTVDMENRILECQVWREPSQNKHFACFLDNQGLPVWDRQHQGLSPGLKDIISSYQERTAKQQDDSGHRPAVFFHYKPPFHILPLVSETQNTQAELCLASEQESLNQEERTCLEEIAALIISALERIQIQKSLELRNEELSLALDKNRQINHELIQTERLAAVGQLAAGAAHEINNPLAIINARAQLMQLREADEKNQDNLQQITEQIGRISSILTNLMDFARPSPPQLQQIFLPDLLEKLCQLIEPALNNSEIELQKTFPRDLPCINADPNQLEQVFLNLLLNAQQAMEDKGGKILLQLEQEQASRYILVRIVDQGVGISSRDLKRIFDPFFSTKEPGKGTGLGLSTSLSIIQNHHGKLDIQSSPDRGSSIIVQLPMDLQDLSPQAEQDQALERPLALSSLLKSRILIKYAEQHILEILSNALQAENMEPVCVSRPEQVLQLLQNQSFDLLLLDMQMSILDDLSLIGSVQAIQPDLPILLVTSQTSRQQVQEALNHGVTRCINKPFQIKSLLKEIYDLLASK